MHAHGGEDDAQHFAIAMATALGHQAHRTPAKNPRASLVHRFTGQRALDAVQIAIDQLLAINLPQGHANHFRWRVTRPLRERIIGVAKHQIHYRWRVIQHLQQRPARVHPHVSQLLNIYLE